MVDTGGDMAWLSPAGWGVRFDSDLPVLCFLRPLLDLHVRRRLAADPRVRILANTDVVGLAADEQNRGVAGALVRARDAGDAAPYTTARAEEFLPADFVVDAAGRGSRAPRWLAELGYPPPPETIVNSFRGYASRLYRIPDRLRGRLAHASSCRARRPKASAAASSSPSKATAGCSR